MTNLALLIAAIIQVESGGNWATPPNEHGAAGGMQIKPCWIRDVNRILQLQGFARIYKSEDRYDKGMTKWATYEWFDHYAEAWQRKYGRLPTLREKAAWWRIGYKASQDPTKEEAKWEAEYWMKIEKEIKKGRKA